VAKRSKFQAELIMRSRPPSAFDVLREAAVRLQRIDAFPPGIIPAVGLILQEVLDEADTARTQREADKAEKEALAVVDSKAGE
jgi:hypothetical protein